MTQRTTSHLWQVRNTFCDFVLYRGDQGKIMVSLKKILLK